MSRRNPPPGEAPLLCEECSSGCTGHDPSGCLSHSCECQRVRTRAHDALEKRWNKIGNMGTIAEDATLIAGALMLAAAQYDCDARSSSGELRVRAQFEEQAIRCRIIAKEIEL